ncbi:M20 family metallopeptidase [Gemmatimonas sp.]|uniref:M20 metallopeptidase family protein n=1 Tax=Gemmatimonas sp. TaxID=1962908 RepID=UPI0027BACBB8|nr:M20 family metallopeptidase [Gemmatimonas sp.]
MTTSPIQLAGVPDTVLQQFTASQRDALLALRRDLHQHPELAFAEERTCAALERALAAANPVSITRVAGTGLVARIRGRDSHAPVVAVRGDIDALPIQEATGLPYASVNPGVMHACGHDVHASWAIGAAYLLANSPAAGDVLVVLQPAEETGEGAAAVLASGALDEAAAIFGAHVDRRFPVGQVVAQAGSLAAAADTFTVELHGRGAHGARPHESADPVLGAGLLIAALQGIVSRRVNPSAPAVLTVATMHAGTASNVIPERATIGGTLRATDPVTRALLADELRRVAQGIALAHDLTAEVTIELGPPPIVNPEQQALWARHAAASVLSADAVVPLGITNMGGEDFAYYMERIPGAFLRIGAREPGGEPTPAHTPRFFAADGCLFVGAAVLAETARVASAALSHGR